MLGLRYREEYAVGEGGMGQVLCVEDESLHRQVAFKRLRAEFSEDEQWRQRFQSEARQASRLEHPNIPPVHELGQLEDGTPYYTMRLVRGHSLRAIIDRLKDQDAEAHRLFGFTRRLQIAEDLCEVLEYVHTQGLVHRDIKPDNVMVGDFGEVQLLDWGVSAPLSEGRVSADPDEFVGTPEYAAPESIRGEVCDLRADLYSLGALLFELFTLQTPFSGRSSGEVLAAVLKKRPPIPESFAPPIQGRVPRETSRLILKAMAFEPKDRFASAAEFKRAVSELIQGEIPILCPHTAIKRSMTRLGRFLDNHNSPLTVGLIYLWLLLPILWLIWWVVGWVKG